MRNENSHSYCCHLSFDGGLFVECSYQQSLSSRGLGLRVRRMVQGHDGRDYGVLLNAIPRLATAVGVPDAAPELFHAGLVERPAPTGMVTRRGSAVYQLGRNEAASEAAVNAWLEDVRIGDVIARPNGSWRIVRGVHRQTPYRTYITLAIRRCSWTGRGLTVYLGRELADLGYRRVARNAKMTTELDQRLNADSASSSWQYCVRCTEVRGVA